VTIEQVDIRRYSDAVAAYAAAIDKMLEAVAALQAKAEAMHAADPATLHWGHAGSAAALANQIVDLANEGGR
jgi:hypothetical protein